VFRKIERQLEKAVQGSFGRAFKASVQPVELAHKLAKEMGEHKTVSVSRVYVPNVYEVYLSPEDFGHFQAIEAALVRELRSYLIAHAQREGWTLVGEPRIELYSDAELQLGEFGIATRTEAVASPPASAAPTPPAGEIAPAAPPPGFAETIVAPAAAVEAPIVQQQRFRGTLVLGGQVHSLEAGSIIIGRSRRCDVVLADPNVSRQHAEVRREGESHVIIDLDSTNGVLVNRRAVKRAVLQDGDRIELGATELRFQRRPC